MSNREKQIYRATIVGSVANLALVIFKLIAGIVGHSAAMVADAVHSVSDFVTDIVVLVMVRISAKPRDCDHNYGHGKYETLATAIIGLMLLVVALGILVNGAEKIAFVIGGGTLEAPGMLALVAAVVSIAVKEGLYHYTIHVARRTDSQAVRANAWHHRSDAFSSVAAALGIGGAILLGASWRVLDPLAAVVVSVLIFKVAVQLVVPSVNELLEKSLPAQTEQAILQALKAIPEVSDPHNLRTRRIGPVVSVDLHVRMDPDLTVRRSHEITRRIEATLKQLLGPESIITVHVEPAK